MRTTLNVDDDVFFAAKELAERQRVTLGKAVSILLRRALTSSIPSQTRNGIPLFPRQPDAGIVTLEMVNRLRDEEPV